MNVPVITGTMMMTRMQTTLASLLAAAITLVALPTDRLGAQPFDRVIAPPELIVFSAGDSQLPNPFSGGLDLARIGLFDDNGDNLPDLWTYNLGGELRRYENRGDLLFIRDTSDIAATLSVRSWFRFFDFDGDAQTDLFTAGERSEVLFFRNIGSNNALAFAEADTLRTIEGTTIFTEQLTLPNFADIDNDGDADLFSGNVDGTITFYENTGTRTEPILRFRTSRYEGLIIVSPASTEEKGGGSPTILHGASVLDFMDFDGDDDLDILFGDFFTRGLLTFENRGDKDEANFNIEWVDTSFAPDGDHVLTAGFNQAESADIDEDGMTDVLVSSLLAAALTYPLELYANEGTPDRPVMRRVGRRVTGEIDVGRRAAPTFVADRERRGLLVGAEDGSLTWFPLDDSSSTSLQFVERRRFLPGGLSLSSPAAGDIDGDGLAEIVVGKSDALDGTTMRLYRFDDEGSLERIPWQLDTTFNIVRSGAAPALVDLDGDDDLDLFVGGRNGRFALFANNGSPQSPRFEFTTPPQPFDTLDLGSNAAPFFADLDDDGDPDALVGYRDLTVGTLDSLRFWRNDDGRFVENPAWPVMVAGQYPVPLTLEAGGHRFLLAGSGPGGLLAFRGAALPNSSVAIAADPDGRSLPFRIVDHRLVIVDAMSGDDPRPFALYDIEGRRVRLLRFAGRGEEIDLAGLVPGLYVWRYNGTAGRLVLTP